MASTHGDTIFVATLFFIRPRDLRGAYCTLFWPASCLDLVCLGTRMLNIAINSRERRMERFVFTCALLIFAVLLCLFVSRTCQAQQQATSLPDAPKPQPGTIVGTVTDVNDDTVAGASVVLEDPALKDPRTVISNNNGFF